MNYTIKHTINSLVLLIFEYLPIVPSNAVTLQDKDISFKEIIPKQGTTTQQKQNNICHLPSARFKAFSGFAKFDISIKLSRSDSLPAQRTAWNIKLIKDLNYLNYIITSSRPNSCYQRKNKQRICTVTPEKGKNCLVKKAKLMTSIFTCKRGLQTIDLCGPFTPFFDMDE